MRLPSRAAASRSPRSTLHCDAGPVRASKVEPCLRSLWLALCPRLDCGDGCVDLRLERRVTGTAEGVELDLPPEADRLEQLTRLGGCGPARLREQVRHLVEAAVEDRVRRPVRAPAPR